MRTLDFSHPRHPDLQESDSVPAPALLPLLGIQELTGKTSAESVFHCSEERSISTLPSWLGFVLGQGRMFLQEFPSPFPVIQRTASRKSRAFTGREAEELRAFGAATPVRVYQGHSPWGLMNGRRTKGKKGFIFERGGAKFLAVFQRQPQGIVLKVELGKNWSLTDCKGVSSCSNIAAGIPNTLCTLSSFLTAF